MIEYTTRILKLLDNYFSSELILSSLPIRANRHLSAELIYLCGEAKLSSFCTRNILNYGNICYSCGHVGDRAATRPGGGRNFVITIFGLKQGWPMPITIDHIIPLSIGGGRDISNLQPLCDRCNQYKKNSLPEQYEFQLVIQRDGLLDLCLSLEYGIGMTLLPKPNNRDYYIPFETLCEDPSIQPEPLLNLCKKMV